MPVEHTSRWLATLAGLHDFGKAVPGFQAKWEAGRVADEARGLRFTAEACRLTAHDLATAFLLRPVLQQRTGAAVNWIIAVSQAVSAHHGFHFLATDVQCNGKPLGEPAQWAEARQTIVAAYWPVLDPQGAPTVDRLTLPAVNWLAGLTSIADWIASNPDWFPLGERKVELSDYYEDARRLAADALRAIGWRAARNLLGAAADTGSLLTRIVGREGLAPRPLQQAGERLLGTINGPALLLVEAPMGEGKTELAFLAHLRLQAANGHRGLYVALPTQATGNALFERALTFLRAFIDDHADVQLAHGGAAMNESVRHLRSVDHSRQESLSASAWFSQRRRPLLSPYGVGTIDQALLAVLNVKHHFVRLWGLGNRVVVLDEVHAYDTYTSGLIAVLLQWLRAMNCSVALMSATLPRARRAELLKAWGIAEAEQPELPYPRVMLADTAGVRGEHFAARPMASIHIAGIEEGLEAIADQSLALLAGGGCGAIIVNTVDRAQRLHGLLSERGCSDSVLLLFHARFPADERAALERQVLDCFGQDKARPDRALLIATQVAEQSLDIDFDFLLSDLAPVDLLLQRAGRLHRHDRKRPLAHVEPRLWVAGLLPERPPELKATAWGYVYEPYILSRTWALLKAEECIELPGDIDRLVQAVYGDDELPDDLEDAVRNFIEIEAYGAYRARLQKERRESFNVSIDPDAAPLGAYDNKPRGNDEGEDIGLENRTRLGPESITLIPVQVSGSGWRLDADSPVFQVEQVADDALARQLVRRQLKCSRPAVVRHFKNQPLPPVFADHPLLRHCWPLPLREARYDVAAISLRLDRKLGLIYGDHETQDKQSSG